MQSRKVLMKRMHNAEDAGRVCAHIIQPPPHARRGHTADMTRWMMEHMAARIQAGPLPPEESKLMAELMQRITDMTNHLTWMMGGGTSVIDMPQQMATMTEQLTEVHKRVMSLIAASMPAPQKDKQ